MRDPVVFPFGLTPLLVDGEDKLAILRRAMASDRLLAIFPEMPDDEELGTLPVKVSLKIFTYAEKRRSMVGVLARVVKELKFPDGSVRIVVRGVKRISFSKLELADGVPVARFRGIPENREENENEEVIARQKSVLMLFQELAGMMPGLPDELQVAVLNAGSPARMADMIADSMSFSYPEKLLLLVLSEVRARQEFLAILLNRELEVMKLSMKIQSEVSQVMSQQQREFYLREQLRTIQEELGEDSRNPDIIELEKRIGETELPDKVSEVIAKEMARLEVIPQAAPEYHISYTYITWLLDVPWLKFTEDRLDCQEAAKVLDADHYGLEDVKERILEFLAVLQLRKNDDRKAPILCLVGPPGVGKTSLGQSIARAMNRNFVRVSLGGVRDEAEIRGHRRTYVGAMPGRIVQNLKKAGTANPVFMLDEIDKLANDFRGDPASALLEVLDPAQNYAFNDHYLEVDCDLSKVFFIATANLLDTIPGPLRDRMEIIRLPGYTSFEKREIARRYLVPRQLKASGLTAKQVRFHLSGVDELIDYYTREAGVRDLERTVGQVLRKIARRIVEGKIEAGAPVSVTPKLVQELLGPRKFLLDEAENAGPGYATGMAWTSCGGVILPIEVIAIPGGKGALKLTGSLGKVMQESAETAFSLIRAHAAEWKIEPAYFNEHDFHIHVPDGATPKDGPSAGITLTLALISLLTGRSLIPRLSMTGEITLRGRVTAVGGIREKVIAALRAGIRQVILPEENRKDTLEIPEEVRKKLEFH
ncbi:endopeptidase La, partial [uncultured Victivallis sp.]|uniref:endopeptidase La n=1 Tax=uncultured Victivallis sp. TaxID=354118 RepID=UPI002582654E